MKDIRGKWKRMMARSLVAVEREREREREKQLEIVALLFNAPTQH